MRVGALLTAAFLVAGVWVGYSIEAPKMAACAEIGGEWDRDGRRLSTCQRNGHALPWKIVFELAGAKH